MLNTPNRKEILKEGPPQNSTYKILGRGAYGTVFKAIFRGKPVAVKIMRNVNEANAQAMRNEANILGWKHRNITRTLKIESTLSFGIVIMERFMGESLQTILETVVLPLEHRFFIILDVLSALSYCHKRELLHLDVKPQNILVSFGAANTAMPTTKAPSRFIAPTRTPLAEGLLVRAIGREYICKLCDFGASMKMNQESSSSKSNVHGTVRYMSPEALREEPLSPAADIYSLGIMMWQLQQRQLPYYWIQCNDVVAYQVVKQNLRPDAKNSSPSLLQQCTRIEAPVDSSNHNNSSDVSLSYKCTCLNNATTASTEITCHSLEYITLQLNSSKAPEDQLNFSAESRVEQCWKTQRRHPFQHLNARMNVMRDLRSEWDVKRIVRKSEHFHSVKPADFSDGQQKWASLFQSILRMQDKDIKELSYTNLYRMCWHSEASQRLIAHELRRRIVELL